MLAIFVDLELIFNDGVFIINFKTKVPIIGKCVCLCGRDKELKRQKDKETNRQRNKGQREKETRKQRDEETKK